MKGGNSFRDAVTSIHAAGLDPMAWPSALRTLCSLFGAAAADLEVTDKQAMRLVGFHQHGVAPACELAYALEHHKVNSRVRHGLTQRTGDIGFDRQHIDEAGMEADPFYEFLAFADLRYYVSAVLVNLPGIFAVLAIHRAPRAGHVGQAEIALMRRLVPHLQQAHDMNGRLPDRMGRDMLESIFHWVPDGVVLVAADGAVHFANRVARLIAARGDGIGLFKDRIEFSLPSARRRYEAALQAVRDLIQGLDNDLSAGDFAVPRPGGVPGYLVSVRPILPGADSTWSALRIMAVVFIRDPLTSRAGQIGEAARQLFGLTEAEANLAEALARGVSPLEYARAHNLSLNTVYTHLRHSKAKMGARRMSDLVGRLGELRAPLLRGTERQDR